MRFSVTEQSSVWNNLHSGRKNMPNSMEMKVACEAPQVGYINIFVLNMFVCRVKNKKNRLGGGGMENKWLINKKRNVIKYKWMVFILLLFG